VGTYRLILALAVVFSHEAIFLGDINQGIAAVISFLLISGMVITRLIEARFNFDGGALKFYRDRALRIYPQYLFYLLIAVVSLYLIEGKTFGIGFILVNALNIPLNFLLGYQYDYIIIPPSWSLALELQFYLVIPWLLSVKKEVYAAYFSLFFYFICYTGLLNTDYFGYRMLSGMLFVFLSGSMLAHYRKNAIHLIIIYVIVVAMYLISFPFGLNLLRYNSEVLLGFIFGIPVIIALMKLEFGKFDVILGNVSYGVYINHTILMKVLPSFEFYSLSNHRVTLLIISSLCLAIFSTYLIEKPFYRLRHSMFKSRTVSDGPVG
jgi:peptidoglycan/LPS O-acetylase OafA/YrhL